MSDSNHDIIPLERPHNQKSICIVQITRFGDLIQTLQTCSHVKIVEPKAKLILIARKQFAGPLDFMLNKVFDEIIYIDHKDLVGTNREVRINTVLAEIENLISTITDTPIDVLINLSWSKSSAYLCTLIEAKFKLGMSYSHTGALLIPDKWSQYIYANVMTGPFNPFSLVDIYKKIIGVPQIEAFPKQSPAIERTSSIIIHPFASNDKKSWKIEKWSEIIYQILRCNPSFSIVLAGAENELTKSVALVSSTTLQSYADRIINLVGKASIEALSIHIKKAQLFIGHDSMVGHLASFYDLPSITISLGTVRPIETVPYGENNYVVVPKTKCFPCFPDDPCEYYQCHHDIPYQVVTTAINSLITNGEINHDTLKDGASQFYFNKVSIYRSSLSKSGFLDLNDLLEQNKNTQDIFRLVYRIAWTFLLEESEEDNSFPELSYSVAHELNQYLRGIQHLFELSQFGKKYSQFILVELDQTPPDLENIRDHSKKLEEVDQLKKTLIDNFPKLSPIVDFYTIAKSNLAGDSLKKLTESSYIIYEECSTFLSIIYELIESCLEDYKKNQAPADVNPRGSNAASKTKGQSHDSN